MLVARRKVERLLFIEEIFVFWGTTYFLRNKPDKQKRPHIYVRPCFHTIILAPRPGLEPGTYGLTEIQARQKSI